MRAYANLSAALSEAARLERAVGVGRAGIARLQTLGYDDGAAILRCVTATALRDIGAWDEADRLALQTLQGPVSGFTAGEALEVRATIAVRRGDLAAARTMFDEADSLWSTSDAEVRADLDAALVELALAERRVEEVRKLIDEASTVWRAAKVRITPRGSSRSDFGPRRTRPTAGRAVTPKPERVSHSNGRSG